VSEKREQEERKGKNTEREGFKRREENGKEVNGKTR